jgi:hypothetical protein
MTRFRPSRLVVLVAVVGVAAGGGGAIAATKVLSPDQERQAFLNDAAEELGVEPSELGTALKNAFKKRVDAAVEAGRLSKAQGDRLKERIDRGDVPLFLGPGLGRGFGSGPPLRFRHHGRPGLFHSGLDAAASYLGLTRAKLHAELAAGKTLAQVAKQQGKSVDGLVDALLADHAKRLDAAVEAGRLTKAERDRVVADLKARFTDMANGRFRPHVRPFGERRFRERRAALGPTF